MRRALGRGIVPAQVVVAVGEGDVGLVEDGGPLEGRAVQALARGAVAVFGGEGALAAELVLDAAAVALAVPGGFGAGGVVGVDFVGGSVFPLVFLAVGGVGGLVLVVFLGVSGGFGVCVVGGAG